MDNEETRGGYLAPVNMHQLPSRELRTPYPDYEDSMNLRDYLEPLFRRKWTILFFALALVIPTFFYTVTRDPIYQALGWVELSPSAPKVTKFEDVMASPFKSGANEFTRTQMELLQSGALARRVSERLGLEQNPVFRSWCGLDQEEPGVVKAVLGSVISLPRAILSTVKEWVMPADEPVAVSVSENMQQLRMQNPSPSQCFSSSSSEASATAGRSGNRSIHLR